MTSTQAEKRQKVVDVHHHYVPAKLVPQFGGKLGETVILRDENGTPKLRLHPALYDIEVQLRTMDEVGIDVAVLSSPFGWRGTIDDCREVNKEISNLVRQYPSQLIGLAHVPPLAGSEMENELKRAKEELGLKGVAIASRADGIFFDMKPYIPFFSTVERLGYPIFVHPSSRPEGFDALRGYDLHRILGREFDLVVSIVRLILGGVLQRFPGLRFIFSHLGGGIAALKERLEAKQWSEVSPGYRNFSTYFTQLYFDTAGFEGGRNALDAALTSIPMKKLLFGTDYPQDFSLGNESDMRLYVKHIRELPLKGADADKDRALGLTALTLFS